MTESTRDRPAQIGWLRFFPAFEELRTYSLTAFRKDLFAGTTVAAVAVPQAMAYASIFGMPPQYGLYTAIVMTAVGAVLASAKQLINGPTNAISIAMLSALAVVPADQRIDAAIMMALLIGAIQTGISLLRLGDLTRYISHAVIVGFTAGASVLLILDQLKNAMGWKEFGQKTDHFLKRFWLTFSQGETNWTTFSITVGTIVVALLLRVLNRRFRLGLPELLLAIAAAGGAVYWFSLGRFGVALVPALPKKLPTFSVPTVEWAQARELLGSATAIAILGLLEAVAMSKSLVAKSREKLDMNQQCLSEGLANLAGSFFQCFPGSGSLTRSYINQQAGAATQWSGVVSAVMVALAILAFAPLAVYIPKAALAGILLLSGFRMIDFPSLTYHLRATRFDAIIVVATALSAVCISIEFCILVGTLLSFLFYVPRAARVELTELMLTPSGVIRDRMPNEANCPRFRLYNFEGELFFGSAPDFESHLEKIEAEVGPQARIVILRCKYLRNPDAVCMELLARFIERMEARGILVALTGVRDEFYATLENVGIASHLGERVFREVSLVWSSTMSAVTWAYSQLGSDRCEDCPRKHLGDSNPDGWHFMI